MGKKIGIGLLGLGTVGMGVAQILQNPLGRQPLVSEIELRKIAVRDLKKLVSRASRSKKVVTVEIENIGQLKKILGLKFKRILFDNMSISQLKKCLKLCNKKYETEYSGNANLSNIKKISRTGINRISVGAITHSAKTFDTSLLLG